jgi:ribosomal protein L29
MKISNSNSKDNMSMSTQELIKELKEAEKVLFDLRFKKATRQQFKPH